MKKIIGVSFFLSILLLIGCSSNGVKQIKADTFDIGLGQSLYSGDEKMVQSLVKAYNQVESTGKTDQPINYQKAITITFIHNDQISGSIVIDDKGVFHVGDNEGNYQIEQGNELYDQAVEVYMELEKRVMKK